MIRMSFFGAAGEVTGSCTLIETGRARVLVDFGLHQGSQTALLRNRRLPPIDPARLDAVLLTHGHLDHCGRLPLLRMAGFKGRIYTTPASIELSRLILLDSAHIQEEESARLQRHRGRHKRSRHHAPQPLYTQADAERILDQFSPLGYDESLDVADGVTARLIDAGHILGSASLELSIAGQRAEKRLVVFSGDIGEKNHPLIRDPAHFAHADHVVLESTYGDRDHRPTVGTENELADIIEKAKDTGGKILIPAFAVGRTQTLLYFLNRMQAQARLGIPVIVDSPMAITATTLYRDHPECYDDEAATLLRAGDSPMEFPGLRFTRTATDSASLNTLKGPAIIISASGMCNAGRILHHLRHHLANPSTHICFVGFQAEGTLGRRIIGGARSVRIMGEEIPVQASVHTLGGLSAHAGRTGLLAWAQTLATGKPRMYLNHGEDGPRQSLAESLRTKFGIVAARPMLGDSFDL